MAKPNPYLDRLRDPFNAVTRKNRRDTLAASAIGIVIAKTGLVPSKISALGIEFTETDQAALLWVIAAIVIYFGCTFVVYVSSELVAWQVALRSARVDHYLEHGRTDIDSDEYLREVFYNNAAWLNLSRPMFVFRVLFEVVVPIALCIYAAVALFTAHSGTTVYGTGLAKVNLGTSGKSQDGRSPLTWVKTRGRKLVLSG